MANPNLMDMVEEDAADLQFPKENPSRVVVDRDGQAWQVDRNRNEETNADIEVSSTTNEDIFQPDPICINCRANLSEPYVRCAVCCDTDLCLSCFSCGSETADHKNDHDYAIVRDEFSLIPESNWSAREESELLDALQECGFGNWVDTGRRMRVKSGDECRFHYIKNYIDRQCLPELPKIRETVTSLFGAEHVPYLLKLQDLEEPPRFAVNTVNSRLLAGYNAARSDFEINFDNHAEFLISDLKYGEFEEDEVEHRLGTSLQAAIVQAYNNRLRERARRRKIIRDHGLIAFRRTISWLQRYESTIGRPVAERLLIFMQLVAGLEFDYIMEGLNRVGELKNKIRILSEYRANGLRSFRSVPMFEKLLKLRMEREKERKQYLSNPEYSWRSVLGREVAASPTIAAAVVSSSQRKLPPPLEIRGLPDSEKLAPSEKELCSNARILPAAYFDFKRILINENKKMGSLRLAQARVLLKIDVNKTRKIYDFLAEQGYINKPAQ